MQIEMRYHKDDNPQRTWLGSRWWGNFHNLHVAMIELRYHQINGRHAMIEKKL
jgi:hypothetical protein